MKAGLILVGTIEGGLFAWRFVSMLDYLSLSSAAVLRMTMTIALVEPGSLGLSRSLGSGTVDGD